MIVNDLSFLELSNRLNGTGLCVRIGPFTANIRSQIPSVAEGIKFHYQDYLIQPEHGFIDFHIAIRPPNFIRHWVKPQVLFYLDGQTPFKPLPYSQSFPCLEWGLNWCVANHCHHFLMIHAAVIEKQGRCAILPAPPGSGKSTLTAALINNGWRLLSDELTLITLDTGTIVPIPRPINLKNASITVIQQHFPEAPIGPIVKNTIKGDVAHVRAPTNSYARIDESARAAWIIFPKYEKNTSTTLTHATKPEVVLRMAENSFNYSILGEVGFERLTTLVDQCHCYDFQYSLLDEALEVFETRL